MHSPQDKSSISSAFACCPICYAAYTLTNNKPLVVCGNHHSMCKVCLLTLRPNLRCPFCRQNIFLDSIRLNKTVLDYLRSLSRKGSQISNANSQAIGVRGAQRLITEQTNQWQHSPLRDSYLHESEFLSSVRSEIQNRNSIQNQCSAFVVLLDLYFLLFQLSCGILNLSLAYSHNLGPCIDLPLHDSTITLRFEMQTLGFFQVIFATLFIYFIVLFYLTGVMNMQGLRTFQLMLMFFVQVKNFEAVLFYSKYLMNEGSCERSVSNYARGLLGANGFSLASGFYFLGKLYFYIMDR